LATRISRAQTLQAKTDTPRCAMPPSISMTSSPSDTDRKAISEGLHAYNEGQTGPTGHETVAVLLKSEEGDTVGGLWGRRYYDWLFIELLFVPANLRGQGFGRQLMRQAEAVARERSCLGVWLDTFGFQAPEFYRKLGYEAFGELPNQPRGSRRVFLRKLLASQP
jgi:GNAT superfamily N-acetyltransferase